MDRELHDLLEETANRSVSAVEELRNELRDDRSDTRRRFGRLEGAVFGDDGDDGLIVTVGRIDRRCGALVLEEDGPDGKPVVTARPARLGLDAKFILGLVVTLVVSGLVPILVAHA